MLEILTIRENKEAIGTLLSKRNKDFTPILDKILETDALRRQVQAELDQSLSQANNISKEIGELFKNGQKAEAEKLKESTTELKEKNKILQDQLNLLGTQLNDLLLEIPNIPTTEVPAGSSEKDNITVKQSTPNIQANLSLEPHWEICKKYNLIDFELGNKITGAGFPVYLGKGAKLQRALINFFLDKATEAGFNEVIPPLVVNEDSGFGTGQLPDKEGQMYHVTQDNLYLIPTAEVPITNIYRNQIVEVKQFPIKNCGYTPCFRREAGSYGKDVRGLNRLHQFDKVEIVQIDHPNNSHQSLNEMVAHVESLVQALQLPYRILRLCGGDLGFAAAITYDFEVFSPAQDKWLEVSSVSNFESFQANRLKLRFKEDGNMKLAHTLNGSALALPRIVATLLENHQMDGKVKIPEVLVPYTGFEWID